MHVILMIFERELIVLSSLRPNLCFDCYTGFILRASNGQFTATRFEENLGVDYPIDLARVKASSAEEVAKLWESIKEC